MFNVGLNETFETVARKVYGDERRANMLRSVNPGVFEPIPVGTVLIIPPDPDGTEDKPQDTSAADDSECAVLIDDKRFRFWESAHIFRSIDTIDTMEFTAPFDPDDADQREAFRPFKYPTLKFTVGGVPLFTGIALGPIPQSAADSNRITLGGYSLPGVLQDCNIPVSNFPLEFVNQTLRQIAESVTNYFGLTVAFEPGAEPGAVFERVACQYDKRGLDFLVALAQQRGLVMGSNASGQLVFRKSDTVQTPVALLSEGEAPLENVEASFEHQQYYSHVTGIEPVKIGATGAKYTVPNVRLQGVIRPMTFQVKDAVGGDVQKATEARMGRMFGNMASYQATVATWRTPAGDLWTPNTTVRVHAPSAMIYEPYDFIIRSVSMERDSTSEVAVLELMLPGAFAGEIPEVLPWEG